MATYEEIFGKKIQFLSADPPAAASVGQIWYNDTSDAFKTTEPVYAWAAGGSMTNDRNDGTGSAGILTAGFYTGAATNPGANNVTEEYDGTSWSGGGAQNTTAAQRIGFGTLTAGVVAGGYEPGATAAVEEYNGTSWTSVTSMPETGWDRAGCGIETSGLVWAGAPFGVTTTWEYGGTSWTAGGASPAVRNTTGNGATQDAGFMAGGESPGFSNQAATYNGTAWTTVTNYPISRAGVMSNGPNTDTIAAGGNPPAATTNSNKWDGSAWTATPALGTGRYDGGRFGTGTAAVIAGGWDGSSSQVATEEFTGTDTVRTITTS